MAERRRGLTSPHLITTTERMKINGHNISKKRLLKFLRNCPCCQSARKGRTSASDVFEWLYLMAMLWFGRQGISMVSLKPDLVAD
ncbi:MAG: hypothetical protein ACLR5Q_07415 [Coprococcus sp.]